MNLWIASAALLMAVLAADFFWTKYRALLQRRRAPRCEICHRPALTVNWEPTPVLCCPTHLNRYLNRSRQQALSRLGPPPPLYPLDSPYRQPRPRTWPSCPTCGHHLSQLQAPAASKPATLTRVATRLSSHE